MTTYAFNVLLTNGDIFCREYPTAEAAKDAFDKLAGNKLVAYASLHDPDDNEIGVIDRTVGAR